MRNPKILLGSIAGCLALASCQSTSPVAPKVAVKPQPRPAVAAAPAPVKKAIGINGKWIPTDSAARGIYVAEFRDGVFVSRSTSTNKPLAKGSYKNLTEKSVDLNFVGAATKTAVQAKCERQTSSTLYCVPSLGSPFNLRRV